MEQATDSAPPFADLSKHFARRLLTIGENRLELLMLEMQEERERLLRSILLALGTATLGLLAALTLTGALVVLLGGVSPALVLLSMTALYGGTAIALYRRLSCLIRDWESFPATLDQLKQDHACLEKSLT
ncbi:MAG: hypothetical protein QOF48_2125 [Verrucomicrobiota bacterium]|jgi:uncharacterized membrane protein YqjE